MLNLSPFKDDLLVACTPYTVCVVLYTPTTGIPCLKYYLGNRTLCVITIDNKKGPDAQCTRALMFTWIKCVLFYSAS